MRQRKGGKRRRMVGVVAAAWAAAGAAGLGVGAALHRSAAEAAADRLSGGSDRGRLEEGPWGEIEWSRIVLRPPEAAVRALLAGPREVVWTFRGMSPEEFAEFVAGLDVPERMLARLLEGAAVDEERETVVLRPSAELRAQLPLEARSAIYRRLAVDAANPDQVNALRYWAETPEQWFDEVGVPEGARGTLERLAYRNGAFQAIADLRLVAPAEMEPAERLSLAGALASEATVALSLRVRSASEVEGLVRYWGEGGREEQVRPLLRAAAASGAPLDVRLLLPEFAQRRLYAYPVASESTPLETGSRDCHWSALNFFNAEPEDGLGEAGVVSRVMGEEYEPAVGAPRLGDVLVFVRDGEAFHSAVHVAGDIVFTRNGTRPSRPWMLLPLPVMLDFYPGESEVEVVRLRRAGGRGGKVG